MRYVSTRGQAPALSFADVLLAGLASDGGLYQPETWPRWTADGIRALRGLSYAEVATRVMTPFVGEDVAPATLARLIEESYAGFDHRAVVPMVQLDSDLWLMELFHGPTLAFKDVALQLVGRLFDHVLAERGTRITVVGATSGDTGSAAIEACRDRALVDIVMLHPKGRVSEVQRRQMTTVLAPNVHNVAVDGTFDDCQDLVKAMFNDAAFRAEMRLSAVNSINWARIAAQTAYTVHAAVQLGAPDRPIAVAVPTGNFGNVYSAYVARAMGVPIERLAVGSNRNDILTRCLEADDLSLRGVAPTLSPSMDIQVSSNFERLLFDLYDRDGAALADAMQVFRRDGQLVLGQGRWDRLRALFRGASFDDEATVREIARVHAETGEIVDPHTAIGIAAAREVGRVRGMPTVAMATAHPAKFPDAVERAIGTRPALPARLADLLERPERCTALPNDLGAVQAFVRQVSRANG